MVPATYRRQLGLPSSTTTGRSGRSNHSTSSSPLLWTVSRRAPAHPEWRTTQPFQAVLENDTTALGAAGVKGILELVVATHAGMTTDDFERIGKEWFAGAKHPRFNRPYTDMAFLPMVELLGHLRANGFGPTSSRAAATSSCA
jgi:hypothetical protein